MKSDTHRAGIRVARVDGLAQCATAKFQLGSAGIGVYSRFTMPTIILIILAILLPPLAVYLKTNSGKQTIINLILCLFFWVPGVLHALYLILSKA
jgi:uncharacterized membrane protein YqaE (UPF0057 family)